MAETTRVPFLARLAFRLLDWLGGLRKDWERQATIKRDAKLNLYHCTFKTVVDGSQLVFGYDVIAENETQARQLATAEGHKTHPTVIVTDIGSPPNQVPSPFTVEKLASVEAAWAVTAKPDDARTKELKKKGEFGPARISGSAEGVSPVRH
jgi:hypothetical protein